jgi:hypothetical protein
MSTPEVCATLAGSSSDSSDSELAEAQQQDSDMAPVACYEHSGCSVLEAAQTVPGAKCLRQPSTSGMADSISARCTVYCKRMGNRSKRLLHLRIDAIIDLVW